MSEPSMKSISRGSAKGGLIQFEYDERLLSAIEKALGNLKGESRNVLKRAVNITARQAKADLADKARETYVVKKTRFTKAMRTKNATQAKPEATIHVTGKQMELYEFKSSPARARPGKARPDVVKAKVLLSRSLRPLQKGDLKAFLVTFDNNKPRKKKDGTVREAANGQGKAQKKNHTTIAQRQGASRFPIKKLLSNSIPKMIGSQKRVYGVVEPNIYQNLMKNIRAEIDRVLEKGAV